MAAIGFFSAAEAAFDNWRNPDLNNVTAKPKDPAVPGLAVIGARVICIPVRRAGFLYLEHFDKVKRPTT